MVVVVVDDPHDLAKEHSQQKPNTTPFPRMEEHKETNLFNLVFTQKKNHDLKTTPLSLASNRDTASSLASWMANEIKCCRASQCYYNSFNSILNDFI